MRKNIIKQLKLELKRKLKSNAYIGQDSIAINKLIAKNMIKILSKLERD